MNKKEYYQKNKEKYAQRYKEWVKTHRENRKKSSRKYYNKNKEICNEKTKLNILKNKKELIEYLKDKSCEYCGSKDRLHFHHIDTKDKLFEIVTKCSSPINFSVVLEEIKKCRILCSKCHTKEHKKYREMVSKLINVYKIKNSIQNIRDVHIDDINQVLDNMVSQ